MRASGSLSERDLRALVAVIEDGRRDDPGPGLPWAVLDRLDSLVGCDSVGLVELDLRHQRVPLEQWLEAGERGFAVDSDDSPENALYWKLYRDFRPCHDPTRPPQVRVLRWSDVYTVTELHNAPLFAELYGPSGAKHHMTVESRLNPSTPGACCSGATAAATSRTETS